MSKKLEQDEHNNEIHHEDSHYEIHADNFDNDCQFCVQECEKTPDLGLYF